MKGKIKEDDVNAVRERSNLVDVVSEYVALKKKGRLLWGLCPFHQEKTPSFKVDPVAQLYHCFGCDEGGNVFTFVMKVEHLDFPEAVELLANRIGYRLEYEARSAQRSSKKDRMYEANRLAMLFYQNVLHKTAEGERGRSYLKKRGLHADIVREYGIGLAPQAWSLLRDYLAKRGYTYEELLEAGLVVKGSRGYYDRFRGRLIFPITDIRGRVIAFGGRVLDGGQPKYLNSSETPIYRKSATLYGLSMAKNEIAREGSALVVEGYTDVIALSQAGIKNAIATLGTAFTAGHIELLKRFSDRIVLVFDADVAGTKAAESASAYLSEFRPPKTEALRDLERRSGVTGIDVRVVVLPRNLDPADYIALQGADDFRVLINSAEPFFDFYLTRELDKYNISETQQKEQAALAGLKFIATLDPLTHEEYLGKIARKLELDERVLAVRFNAMFKKSMPIRSEARRASINPQDKVERSLLHLMMKYSGIREKITAEVVEDYFVSPAHAQLFAVLKKMGAGKFDTKVLDDLDKGLRARATALFLAEPEYEEKNVSKYFEDILASFKDFYFKRQISKLRQKLESPSVQKDKAYYDALFEELIALEAKRRALR